MVAEHVDKRFGQLFDEVSVLMDKEAKERYVIILFLLRII